MKISPRKSRSPIACLVVVTLAAASPARTGFVLVSSRDALVGNDLIDWKNRCQFVIDMVMSITN